MKDIKVYLCSCFRPVERCVCGNRRNCFPPEYIYVSKKQTQQIAFTKMPKQSEGEKGICVTKNVLLTNFPHSLLKGDENMSHSQMTRRRRDWLT
ncbi:CLUMA_CG019704, isoform A [Clunio marinus]|uniref:CLUMA_CG019704, isoform A n=1 Tax=Clunio marinus TaxID=568069 RepID=A0A1J1J6I0_9DIPT|nr:CLUMA_CG019704, isoform A [Clunio marinus]